MILLEHMQCIKFMDLSCIYFTDIKSYCVWRSKTETMFQSTSPFPETLPTVPFHSGANFDSSCFEINPVKVAEVADVHVDNR